MVSSPSYESIKGRSHRPTEQPAAGDASHDGGDLLAPELSDAQLERAYEVKMLVHQYAPELVPFIRDLINEGLMTGWRDVHAYRIPPLSGSDEAG